MARLPQVGGDNGNWGSILNDFLSQSHASNGQLKNLSVGTAQIQPNSISADKLVDQYAPLREVYLSSYGIVADATDATIANGTAEDYSAEVQQAFNDCIDQSGLVIGRVVHDIPGWILISSPVDMKGVSLVGLGRFQYGFFIDPREPSSTWQFGPASNDLAAFYARNKSNWSVEGVGFDCGHSYTGPLVAIGGDSIEFRNNYSTRVAKNGFQFLGSRIDGDTPVRFSTMTGNITKETRWGFTIDGESSSCKIIDNLGVNNIVRHISVDAGEAMVGKRVQTGTEIRGNTLNGYGEIPAAWATYGVSTTRNHAIYVNGGEGTTASIQSNVITNWDGALRSINLNNFAGIVSNNYCSLAAASTAGVAGIYFSGTASASSTLCSGNVTINYDRGVTLANGVKWTIMRGNICQGASTITTYATAGAGSFAYDNDNPIATGRDEVIRTVSNPSVASSYTTSGATNRAYMFRVMESGTITKIGVEVGTASGNIDVGVYRNSATDIGLNARPLTRVASSGSTPVTAGYMEITLSSQVTVQPGDWLAVALDNTTATLRATRPDHVADPLMKGLVQYKNTSFPLLSSFGSAGTTDSCVYVLIGVA